MSGTGIKYITAHDAARARANDIYSTPSRARARISFCEEFANN